VREVGEGVVVLAEHDGVPVLVQQNNFLAGSFHPELTDDVRVHRYFMDIVRKSKD
jgi:5'-phosphate synthase pdxT subunit